MQETKSLINAERLKEKLGKQDFHYDMKEVFEPVTVKQAEATKNQKQLQEIGQQTATIENQTRAIQQSSDILNKSLQKSIKQGIQDYDEITARNNPLLTSLVNSNQVVSSIVKTVSNLLNDKNKSHIGLEPLTQFGEGNPNLFIINPHNPQQLLLKVSTLISLSNNKMYNLNDPGLSKLITNTQHK